MQRILLLVVVLLNSVTFVEAVQLTQFIDVLPISPILLSEFERSREKIEVDWLKSVLNHPERYNRQNILDLYVNDYNARNMIIRCLSEGTVLRQRLKPLPQDEWERRAIFLMLPIFSFEEQSVVLNQLTSDQMEAVARLSDDHKAILDKYETLVIRLFGKATQGDFSNLRDSLRAGINVNLYNTNDNGSQRTLLHYAAKFGNTAVIRVLIAHGANVNGKNLDGTTPLSEAAKLDKVSAVELLIGLGADVNERAYPRGPTSLYEAAIFGSVNSAKKLIEFGADLNVQAFRRGLAPLHRAAVYEGDAKEKAESLVRLLIENGANVDIQDSFGETPLHKAIRIGNLGIISLLINAKARFDLCDKEGRMPFDLIYREDLYTNNLDAFDLIMKFLSLTSLRQQLKPLPQEKWKKRAIFLMLPILSFQEQTIVLNQLNWKETRKISKLSSAHETVTDKYWYLELRLFRDIEKGEFSELIENLKSGIDISLRRNNFLPTHTDRTFLHYASAYGNISVIKMLTKCGLDVNAKDHWGETPLHRAASNSNTKAVNLLIELGAAINEKNELGNTSLHEAVRWRGIGCVKELIKHGADINAKNIEGKTPLHLAVKDYDSDKKGVNAARILIENGANIDAQDLDGETVLHSAIRAGDFTIVSLLIDAKANIYLRNKEKITSLDLAIYFSPYIPYRERIVDLLRLAEKKNNT